MRRQLSEKCAESILSAYGCWNSSPRLRSIRSTWTHPNYVLMGRALEKCYTLLHDALRIAGYASLAPLSLPSREHVVLLRQLLRSAGPYGFRGRNERSMS
jgi:hypothetical protein